MTYDLGHVHALGTQFKEIPKAGLKGKTIYDIGILGQELHRHVVAYEEAKNQIINDLGEDDGKGGKQVTPSSPNFKKTVDSINALGASKVEVTVPESLNAEMFSEVVCDTEEKSNALGLFMMFLDLGKK